MFKNKPWHSIFFAAFPPVFLYSQNIEIVRFADVVKPLLVILGVTVVLTVFVKVCFQVVGKGRGAYVTYHATCVKFWTLLRALL